MLWVEVHDTFLEAVEALTDLTDEISDYSVPALGSWDARALTGHMLRSVTAPVRHLANPEPDSGPLPSAAAYYLAYLEWRRADSDTADAEVAARGEHELDGIEPERFSSLFRASAAAARAALQGITGDRKVTTPFGAMRIQDYLRTRTLEVTVHGIDLARATGVDWSPPDTGTEDSLLLLTEISLQSGRGNQLLLALTGRDVDASAALPVLR